MKLSHENYDQLSVVTLQGDLAAESVPLLRKRIAELLESKTRDFVLDMSQSEFVDSQGLETLLWTQEQCGERLGQMRLAGITPNVEKILQITRLLTRFDRHRDVDAAIKSLRL